MVSRQCIAFRALGLLPLLGTSQAVFLAIQMDDLANLLATCIPRHVRNLSCTVEPHELLCRP